jgi:hypothetical protein
MVWALVPIANVTMTVWLPVLGIDASPRNEAPLLAIALLSVCLLTPLGVLRFGQDVSRITAAVDALLVYLTVGPIWFGGFAAGSSRANQAVCAAMTGLKLAAFARYYGWILPSVVRHRGRHAVNREGGADIAGRGGDASPEGT